MKNYNSKEWLLENGISDDSISVKDGSGHYAHRLSTILDRYSRIVIMEAIETAACHVDGEIDKDGALINSLKQFGLTI